MRLILPHRGGREVNSASQAGGSVRLFLPHEGAFVELILPHGEGCTQVARSVGPLFTVLLAYLVLDQRTTGIPLACLDVTLAGTALASWQEPTFSMLTFCLMLTINTTLTFRNAPRRRVALAQRRRRGARNAGNCTVLWSGGPPAPLPSAAQVSASRGALQPPEEVGCWLRLPRWTAAAVGIRADGPGAGAEPD